MLNDASDHIGSGCLHCIWFDLRQASNPRRLFNEPNHKGMSAGHSSPLSLSFVHQCFSTSVDPDSIDKYAKRDSANTGEPLLVQYQAQIAASLRQTLAAGMFVVRQSFAFTDRYLQICQTYQYPHLCELSAAKRYVMFFPEKSQCSLSGCNLPV